MYDNAVFSFFCGSPGVNIILWSPCPEEDNKNLMYEPIHSVWRQQSLSSLMVHIMKRNFDMEKEHYKKRVTFLAWNT